jgi:hypothetical protein
MKTMKVVEVFSSVAFFIFDLWAPATMTADKSLGAARGPAVRRDKLRDFTVIGKRRQGPETGKPPKLGRAGDLVISFLESR